MKKTEKNNGQAALEQPFVPPCNVKHKDALSALKYESTKFLFAEDQARYLIACEFDQAEDLFVEAGKQNIPIQTVGNFKGDAIIFGNSSSKLASLSAIFSDTFKSLFQN